MADPHRGSVRIRGRLSGDARGRLAIVVHGLGGSADSYYARRAAVAASGLGIACLRLSLRGADGSGEDFYHAGLTADLHAAMASPELVGFDEIVLLGFSLGGHLALRYATEPGDPRLRAVAAVCAPLDLAACAGEFDRPARRIYRGYVLGTLKRLYRPVAERHAEATPLERVLAARFIREWDELTVVPRWGFDDADDYYRTMSVGPRLDRLRAPALLAAARHDPLVPPSAIGAFVEPAPEELEVVWLRRGGHVAFPGALDLGLEGPGGIEGQALAWLARRAGSRAVRPAPAVDSAPAPPPRAANQGGTL